MAVLATNGRCLRAETLLMWKAEAGVTHEISSILRKSPKESRAWGVDFWWGASNLVPPLQNRSTAQTQKGFPEAEFSKSPKMSNRKDASGVDVTWTRYSYPSQAAASARPYTSLLRCNDFSAPSDIHHPSNDVEDTWSTQAQSGDPEHDGTTSLNTSLKI
ncbi:hypothetical protein NA56DRAFT_750573 [Hyaloscypha hepaticicola]|uniref:Uncharacterized protein n=1 Tax=Hyaloscypha hepaticicola TaxID=2082293 RepID=A0A2J6PZV3_9HELO|nr:hypothetical protein NA56DRAFT_750573 [Hyaloscypha hepaticicola]